MNSPEKVKAFVEQLLAQKGAAFQALATPIFGQINIPEDPTKLDQDLVGYSNLMLGLRSDTAAPWHLAEGAPVQAQAADATSTATEVPTQSATAIGSAAEAPAHSATPAGTMDPVVAATVATSPDPQLLAHLEQAEGELEEKLEEVRTLQARVLQAQG